MAMTRNSANFAATKKHCCLFCYKPVVDKIVQSDNPVPQNDKMKTFQTFYHFICSIDAPQSSASSCNSSTPTIITANDICDDCFYGIDTYCKLAEEIKALQLKLNWNLGQLYKIMKSASRIPTRVTNFNESFHYQHKDWNGKIVMTMNQGHMKQAMECRQQILDACSTGLAKVLSQKPDFNTAVQSQESLPAGHLEDNVDVNENKNPTTATAFESDNKKECRNPQNSDLEVIDVDHPEILTTSVESGIPKHALASVSIAKLPSKSVGQAVYKCSRENCHKFFLNRESLSRHLRQHGQFACKHCNFEMDHANAHETLRHTSKNTDGQFICPRCPKPLEANKHELEMHYSQLGLNGQEPSTSASKPKLTRSVLRGCETGTTNLRGNSVNHSIINLFSCPACDNNFKLKVLLIRHLKHAHPNRTDLIKKCKS